MIEVCQSFFSVAEIQFWLPGTIRVIIALPINEEFQLFIFIMGIDDPVHLPFIVSVFSDINGSRPVRGLPLQSVTVWFNPRDVYYWVDLHRFR